MVRKQNCRTYYHHIGASPKPVPDYGFVAFYELKPTKACIETTKVKATPASLKKAKAQQLRLY